MCDALVFLVPNLVISTKVYSTIPVPLSTEKLKRLNELLDVMHNTEAMKKGQ